MPFFQNPFHEDFEGNWVLGDRQHIPKFVVRRNAGRGAERVTSWNEGPYDLSGNDLEGNPRSTLNISFCLHNTKNWASISVDVSASAADASAVTSAEVVAALNANAIFTERFTASVGSYNGSSNPHVSISQRKPATEFRFYVVSGQAEEALGFNARAGVAELPSYFSRHTLANRFSYSDSQGQLIELSPANAVDAATIDNAVDAKGISLGYDSTDVSADWELLRGRSGIFNFKKITVDGSDRITQVIEYPAGAKAGDMAIKTTYSYTATNNNPDKIAEIPYTLESADLITP